MMASHADESKQHSTHIITKSSSSSSRLSRNDSRKRVPNNLQPPSDPRAILVLHGSRQTGQLLLGRIDKLRKKLERKNIALIAPDAPFIHTDDVNMRQWWNQRNCNNNNDSITGGYFGLEQSLDMLREVWSHHNFIGMIGFSMGARMAHLMVLVHEKQQKQLFPGLQFAIMVAGFDAPLPDYCRTPSSSLVSLMTPSLHVWGQTDKLIASEQSQAVMMHYRTPQSHQHEGGHHVPMRAADVKAYLDFIEESITMTASETTDELAAVPGKLFLQLPLTQLPVYPDDDCQLAQEDEIEALTAIFPDEVTLMSNMTKYDTYDFPISYRIALTPSAEGKWPPHPLSLKVTYPYNYPIDSLPTIEFLHNNNMMEFGSDHMQACRMTVQEAAQAENGMPCVLSCVHAAREFFESGAMLSAGIGMEQQKADEKDDEIMDAGITEPFQYSGVIQSATADRIHECNQQGLDIARQLLQISTGDAINHNGGTVGKGGSWKYTIGLVGKPSAGKSTFFNAATAFARQRDDGENVIGGATMAPHPFTTIDPNIGYCLVPAPPGSCPEDDDVCPSVSCTHGRDHQSRRFIPVVLKDVAGLVPGAYQGRGRGNKFLNDLTDADVLIHVVDASGTADTEGNEVGVTEEAKAAGSHPLDDLAWIRNELIEWVYTNIMFKWDTIKRKGRGKLSEMFSGYKQNPTVLWDVLYAVEKYLQQNEQRDHALDHLDEWDEGDVRRLVSAFLGVRFPMALALNKSDLAPAKLFVRDVQDALPIHGAHVGVPLSSRSEMTFVRNHVDPSFCSKNKESSSTPSGVWQCLQSALTLREPVLVFPVNDMITYASLLGLTRSAMEDASLPNAGMISCLVSSGGSAPTLWNDGRYCQPDENGQLRDVLMMKPGSTVEDVFLSLKRLGALGGEFVRAEGAGRIGEKSKLVPKDAVMGKNNRIIRIMTTKRINWQTKQSV
jgi:ribosome-binding ATPase